MIYKASRIFTGYKMLHDSAIEVQNGEVVRFISATSETNDEVTDLGDALLAPAFIDIQLYGAYGRLLSLYPDAETVAAIASYSIKGGAAWCLPTVATSPYETIFKCIDAIKSYWAKGGKGVIGLHVEGPWINPSKRGAHKQEWIFSPTYAQAKQLLEYGKDVIKIITLAPEVTDAETIKLVQSYGVIVSAGHSNATYEEATAAFDNGIHTATHLYNAMSPLLHRAPGMVGAVLDHHTILSSLVPDGHHVDFAAIRIAKAVMGNRLFAITDAVTETIKGFYRHHLDGDKYTSDGILSGSALTMQKAFKNLMTHCNIDLEEALRMCGLYPAKALQMEKQLGNLELNGKALMIVLDRELNLQELIVL